VAFQEGRDRVLAPLSKLLLPLRLWWLNEKRIGGAKIFSVHPVPVPFREENNSAKLIL